MDKKKQLAFNLNNFLLATSSMLDFVERDFCNTTLNHSKRVAYITLSLAKNLNFTPQEMSDLCSYSLVHNIGLKHAVKKSKDYCLNSQENIKKFPFLLDKENILKYQCEHYDGSGIFSLKGNIIPIFSQLIAFADIIDSKFSFEKVDIENRVKIINFVKENENKLFSKEIVNSFLELSSKTNFWLDLQNESEILYFIFSSLHDFSTAPTFEEVLDITSIFTKVVEPNSFFISYSEKMTDYYCFEHKDKQTFLISASLLSIGKLSVPNGILNKKTKLTLNEFEQIKAYPFYTKKVLSNIIGFNDISTWASNVQETLDSKGYPYGLHGKDLSFKDRLLSSLNIYYALKSEKQYRKAYSHMEAISIMKELVISDKLDKSIVEDMNKIFS